MIFIARESRFPKVDREIYAYPVDCAPGTIQIMWRAMRLHRDRDDRGLVLLALLSLVIGVAVYLLDRGGAAYFVPAELGSTLPVRSAFGVLSGSLPAFVHVLAFSLLTAAALGTTCFAPSRICAAWWTVDTVFELGQTDAFGLYVLDRIPTGQTSASSAGIRSRT